MGKNNLLITVITLCCMLTQSTNLLTGGLSAENAVCQEGTRCKFSSIESATRLAAGVAGDVGGVGQFNDDATSLNSVFISDMRYNGIIVFIQLLGRPLRFL